MDELEYARTLALGLLATSSLFSNGKSAEKTSTKLFTRDYQRFAQQCAATNLVLGENLEDLHCLNPHAQELLIEQLEELRPCSCFSPRGRCGGLSWPGALRRLAVHAARTGVTVAAVACATLGVSSLGGSDRGPRVTHVKLFPKGHSKHCNA